MKESYGFFNSKDHDRVYNAKHWADYFFPLFKSGVFNGDLQVVESGRMSIKVNPGYAWIDGYGYHLWDEMLLDLQTASGNMNRTDSIVLRLDLTNRLMGIFCKTGNYYAGTTTPPVPEITATVHELVLAHVFIKSGTTEITQDMIEDTRMDGNICGWVCGTVKEIDFSQITMQFNQFFANYRKSILDTYNEYKKKAGDYNNQFVAWIAAKKEEISTWKRTEEEATDAWQKKEEDDLTAWVAAKKEEISTWKNTEEAATDAWQKKEEDDFTAWIDEFRNTWEGWINGKVSEWTDEILDWFNNLRKQLTDNAEVHLQEQIGNLNDLRTKEKDSLTSAVNSAVKQSEDSIADVLAKTVKKAGDTMSGTLSIQANPVGETEKIGLKLGGVYLGAKNNGANGSSLLIKSQHIMEIYGATSGVAIGGKENAHLMIDRYNMHPSINESMDLGSGQYRWGSVRAKNVHADTMTSSKASVTYLGGNRGEVIINSTAAAGAYTMLDKLNSTNGYFTDGVYNGNRELHYTPKSTVNEGKNTVEKTVVLLNEEGNASFPGKVSAREFSGNTTSAAKLSTARSINGMLFDGTADRMNYGVCTEKSSEENKKVVCPGFKLATGALIKVRFEYGFYLTSAYTMNVNGQGAIPFLRTAKYITPNTIYTFIFDGNSWVYQYGDEDLIRKHCYIDAYSAADEIKIELKDQRFDHIIVGKGGSSSASASGATDYVQISMLTRGEPASSAESIYNWKRITLGSSGSTARFSISTSKDSNLITVKCPKGSYCDVNIHQLS